MSQYEHFGDYSWISRHVNPKFAPVYLDHRREPSTPLPQQETPSTPPAQQEGAVARPLATATPPAKFHSQYHCPICADAISHQHNADYLGNLPCLHRGPCTKPACVKAYYGHDSKWASPYHGRRHLFCQAAGCGAAVEGWTYVQAVQTPVMRRLGFVMPRVVRDPNWPAGPIWTALDERSELAVYRDIRRVECADGCGWIEESPRLWYRWSLEMPPLARVFTSWEGGIDDVPLSEEEEGPALVRLPLVKLAEVGAAVEEYGCKVVHGVFALRGLAPLPQHVRDNVSAKTFALMCDMEREVCDPRQNRFQRSFNSYKVGARMYGRSLLPKKSDA